MLLAVDIIISLMLIITGYIGVYCYTHKKSVRQIDKGVLTLTRNRVCYLIAAIVSVGILITLFAVIYHPTFIQHLKLFTLINVLLPCAAVDYKMHKIPNAFIIAALIMRVCIVIVEFLNSVPNTIEELKNDGIGALVIGGFFLIMFFLFKNSIGMGDIKLFIIMGLYQGLWGAVNSVFFSLLVSFCVSIVLLATRKKKKKDVIAFAPCIYLGTLIAMSLAGM